MVPNQSSLSRSRLLLANRIMLNKSNSKWITCGITCTPRIAFPECNGFVGEAQLCSEKGSLAIGNERSLRTLFKTIRSDSECQYMQIGTKSDYSDCGDTLFMLNKASFGGTRCLQIINPNGQSCFLSMQAIDDLLKRELLIIALLKSTAKRADECESLFMSMISEARIDYNSLIEKILRDEDIIAIDIFANFTDIVHLCLNIESSKDQLNELVGVGTDSSSAAASSDNLQQHALPGGDASIGRNSSAVSSNKQQQQQHPQPTSTMVKRTYSKE